MVPIIDGDLCVYCISLVGGGRRVVPHAQLREVTKSADAELFHCLTCDAWWDVRKLGWGRQPPGAYYPSTVACASD